MSAAEQAWLRSDWLDLAGRRCMQLLRMKLPLPNSTLEGGNQPHGHQALHSQGKTAACHMQPCCCAVLRVRRKQPASVANQKGPGRKVRVRARPAWTIKGPISKELANGEYGALMSAKSGWARSAWLLCGQRPGEEAAVVTESVAVMLVACWQASGRCSGCIEGIKWRLAPTSILPPASRLPPCP